MMTLLLKKKNLVTLPLLVMIFVPILVSCDKEWPDDICNCQPGGNGIDGWDEANDSTIVNKKDSTGGFAVSMEQWGDTCVHNIRF